MDKSIDLTGLLGDTKEDWGLGDVPQRGPGAEPR